MIDFSDYKLALSPLKFFEEFSKIPRGSGDTGAIADYLVDFAKKRNLFVYRDESDNVVIRKKATKGYEKRPTVIFQGHTDMVAEKAQNVNIDMQKEGLRLYRDGDFLRAEGTTLGADDGVALAYALAVLDSHEIEHPEFEAVFTSDEEVGLLGATALDASVIKGRMLINIDSDEEGIFTSGCAGGARVDITKPITRKAERTMLCSLSLTGLRGGHSGVEIDKQRENAIRVLVQVLSRLDNVEISEITGGNADNAIPRDAIAIFKTSSNVIGVTEALNSIKSEMLQNEPSARFDFKRSYGNAAFLSREDSATLLSLILSLPNGVTRMSEDIEGLVETSLNLGIVRTEGDNLELTVSVRSAVGEEKRKLIEKIKEISTLHSASVSVRGEYPAWEYRKESHLRDVMCRVYREKYGKDARVVTIHAGLECGIFSDKIEGLDCVSIGPDNYDIHTPDERLSLSSFTRVWEYLILVLKNF